MSGHRGAASVRIAEFIRSNIVGFVACFIALGGTAWAGAQIGASDIQNDAVRSKHIKDGQVKSADVQDDSLSTADLGPDSVSLNELAPSAFNSEIVRGGLLNSGYGVANDAIQTNEVSDETLTGADIASNAIGSSEVANDSLTGADINEGSLGASLDIIHGTSSDDGPGPLLGASPTTVVSKEIPAGTYLVLAQTEIDGSSDDHNWAQCSIWTESTLLRYATAEVGGDTYGDGLVLPVMASFTVNDPVTLRLRCRNGEPDNGPVRAKGGNLVAIPVATIG